MAAVNGGTDVKFKGTSIQTADVIVTGIVPFGGLSKTIDMQAVARGNRSRKTNTQSSSRRIPCTVKIKGMSIAELNQNIDNFLLLMDGEGNLDIDINQDGNYRRYIAEPGAIAVTQEPGQLLSANLEFDFVCAEPWGYDLTPTSVLTPQTTQTTATEDYVVTFGGSAAEQSPVITITLLDFTGGPENTLTITNPDTSQQITITRTFNEDDVVVFDFWNMTVKVNDVEVDYTGVWVFWAPGANRTIRIANDFTDRSLQIGVDNNNLWR